ncbi:hypothetical protein QQX98_003928 [Neonectria punicea]|uniref:Heterokaryon incompatibility domain-containing protein n=1 Tax=Neonectria punicea TaxID=979145 RepID=A0ABR1HBI1_9HYPO
MDIPSNWTSRRRRRHVEPKSCPNCKDFDWDELQEHPWAQFCTRPEDVAQTAASGCVTCNILSKAVQHCYPAASNSPSGYKIAFHGLDGPMHWDVVRPGEDLLDASRQNIEWTSLSKTFQDAITFADGMGVEFIWIDSLCIIQNSRQDWEAEAVKMASYYINGQFTIAATSSTDGAGGLYHAVPIEEQAIHIEGLDPKSNADFRVGARRSLAHHHDILEDRTKTNERFPLLTRGWVYQERILSRRFVHFGPREVHWECHEDVSCQCGGIKAALELNPSGKETANQALAISQSTLQPDKMVLLWSKQVENLTRLDFTYISDHLPALAGLATLIVQSGHSGRYLAGLWQEGLLFWLCWSSMEECTKHKTLSGVPSWSWASVAGRVTYDFMTHYFQTGPWGERGHERMLLVNAAWVKVLECMPDEPPLSGTLDSGVLAITGDVAPATLHCVIGGDGNPEFGFSLKEVKDDTSDAQFQWTFQCDSLHPDTVTELDGQSAVVLHLLSYERIWVDYDGPYWMRSMLILKPVDKAKNKYSRVGILYMDVSGHYVPSKSWRSMTGRYGLPLEEIEDVFLRKFRKMATKEVLQLV